MQPTPEEVQLGVAITGMVVMAILWWFTFMVFIMTENRFKKFLEQTNQVGKYAEWKSKRVD